MKQFYRGAVTSGRQVKLTVETEQTILVRVARHAAREHRPKESPPSVLVQARGQIREAG